MSESTGREERNERTNDSIVVLDGFDGLDCFVEGHDIRRSLRSVSTAQ